MEYTLEELVRATRLSVDTVRYYQSLRLLPPPVHRGRSAIYGDEHLDRLRVIRRALEQGFSLKVIKQVLSKRETPDSDSALLSAVEKQLARPCYTRAQVAELLGVPEKLLKLVESWGLADPLEAGNRTLRYSDDDLRIARSALNLLRRGFPLTGLLGVAIKHDRAMRKTAAAAIALFHKRVRRKGKERGDEGLAAEEAAQLFKEVFPLVTSLVAHHFQRVLIAEALKQLKRSGEEETLRVARKSIEQAWIFMRAGEAASPAA